MGNRFAGLLMVLALVVPVTGNAQEASSSATVFGVEPLVWDIRLSDGDLAGLPAISVLEIDGAEATAEDVAWLRAEGIVPICYINAGAWEEWRNDAGLYPQEIIGAAYPGWEGERFVDIRRLDLLGPILEARMDECASKGFAAVDPDNVDTYDTETGFPLTEEDQLEFNRWLAQAAHARGLAIGQKNAPDLAEDLVDLFDFAVTEDCLVDNWCADMEHYAALGKPVLMVEYTGRRYSVEDLCEMAEGTFGAVVIKERDLGAWSAHCG